MGVLSLALFIKCSPGFIKPVVFDMEAASRFHHCQQALLTPSFLWDIKPLPRVMALHQKVKHSTKVSFFIPNCLMRSHRCRFES